MLSDLSRVINSEDHLISIYRILLKLKKLAIFSPLNYLMKANFKLTNNYCRVSTSCLGYNGIPINRYDTIKYGTESID